MINIIAITTLTTLWTVTHCLYEPELLGLPDNTTVGNWTSMLGWDGKPVPKSGSGEHVRRIRSLTYFYQHESRIYRPFQYLMIQCRNAMWMAPNVVHNEWRGEPIYCNVSPPYPIGNRTFEQRVLTSNRPTAHGASTGTASTPALTASIAPCSPRPRPTSRRRFPGAGRPSSIRPAFGERGRDAWGRISSRISMTMPTRVLKLGLGLTSEWRRG